MAQSKISDDEILNEMNSEIRNDFIHHSFHLFNSMDLIDRANGNIIEVLNVFILSDNFKNMNNSEQTTFLYAQHDLINLLKLFDEFQFKNKLFEYNYLNNK
ncbi:hypothetical protein OBK30_01395 [Empedobacter falsenii]